MKEVISIDSGEEQRMLKEYKASGQRQFDAARVTNPDTEADQDAFDRFAHSKSAEVLQFPATGTDPKTTAARAEQDSPVTPLHR